jgi:hypothetical protein
MRIIKDGEESTANATTDATKDRAEAFEDASLEPLDDTARLAEPWTEGDSLRANLLTARQEGDIAIEDFGFYQKCIEETLQDPNELWSYLPKTAKRIYHFLKQYDHDEKFWYVVIAKDTTDETQIEIVDVFPTRDESIIQLCRHGKKEALGSAQPEAVAETDGPIAVSARRNVH